MSGALVLSAFTASTALGVGTAPLLAALRAGTSGLKPCDFETCDLPTWIGEVPGVDAVALPPELAAYHCRNNRLALLGLQADGFLDAARAAIARHGADRVALILGTSTSGILSAELAYRERAGGPGEGALPAWFDYRATHNTGSVVSFVRDLLGLRGPAFAISTACSSSAKAFAAADRLIATGLADAAIVGGVDSLCLTTLYGFASLQLTSTTPCRPCDAARDGISIGEGAAFALLERAPETPAAGTLLVLGSGESSSAHHMSAPHPGRSRFASGHAAGAGARRPAAGAQVINLHGTATPANDSSKVRRWRRCSATACPAVHQGHDWPYPRAPAGGWRQWSARWRCQHGLLPASVGTQAPDPAISCCPLF